MKTRKTAPSSFVRQEYSPSDLRDRGLTRLFLEFQSLFETYADNALGANGINHVKVPNFNQHVGDLERACLAAQTLAPQYDLGVGIAKKGTWLSFVFMLHGFPTYEMLVERVDFSSARRIIHPPPFLPSVEGKRILLFDNDVHTGKSLDAMAQNLLGQGAAAVDALLVYHISEMTRPVYQTYCRTRLFTGHPPIVGRNGSKMVVETVSQRPSSIRKMMTLSRDFASADDSVLVPLAEALGVSYIPGRPYAHLAPVRVVSLDLDGTILKRDFDYALWGEQGHTGVLWQHVGNHLGISPSEAYRRSAALLPEVSNGTIDIRVWMRHFNLPNSEQEIIDAVAVPVEKYDDYHGVVQHLRRSGKRVILATESSGYLLEKKLRDAGIGSDFDAIYSSVDMAGGEKNAAFFRAICQQEGISSQALLHIGDSVTKDYEAPRQAGAHAYHLSSQREFMHGSRGVPYEHQLISLQEIPKLVGGLHA